MKGKKARKELTRWIVVGLPVLAIIGAGFMPLSTIAIQGLILFALLWFQLSLMMGVF